MNWCCNIHHWIGQGVCPACQQNDAIRAQIGAVWGPGTAFGPQGPVMVYSKPSTINHESRIKELEEKNLRLSSLLEQASLMLAKLTLIVNSYKEKQ